MKTGQNHIDAIRSVTQWPIINQLLRQYIRILLDLDVTHEDIRERVGEIDQ